MTFGMDDKSTNPMDALLQEFPEYTGIQNDNNNRVKSRQSVDLMTWSKDEEQKIKTKIAQLQQNLDSCDDLTMLQESLTPATPSPTKKTPNKCILSKPSWIVTMSCSALILYIAYYFGKEYVAKRLKKQSPKTKIHNQKIVLD